MKGWPLVSSLENDAAQRLECEKYNEAIRDETAQLQKPIYSGGMTMHWMQDSEEELFRRWGSGTACHRHPQR
jgi:hypothetical protein